ncbi:hypothetical protein Cni_G22007 [Canna indica]|uniref:Uncharacterized protein n=1 Tax=Canna indica TaxID=4628 RepID=A0AAQ3KUC5_9LILI|nr:hypothetical protein Cni_G22007 [Canna indica]
MVQQQDVEQLIKENWHVSSMSSRHITEVENNLKTMSGKLTNWAKSNIGHLEKSLNEAKEELARLDQMDEEGKCSEQDITRMRCLTNRIMALNKQIHLKWWSKARVKWLEENDKNTRFFHNLAKYKKCKNTINSICQEGVQINDPLEVSNASAN